MKPTATALNSSLTDRFRPRGRPHFHRAFSPDGRSPAGREGICRRSSAKVAPEWSTGGCIFNQMAEAVYRPAAAVYRSAAEKVVDQSTAVYPVYR